ncbi:hypothetical protein HK102_010304, partial [Quaeritorhiza haematococci]
AHRARRRPRCASPGDRRPGGGATAPLQRGRHRLGRPERRGLRISRVPEGTSGERAYALHTLRHRTLGPLLRRAGPGDVRQGPRPVRRLALGPQGADAPPGPGPRGHLPALLRRGRRLAPLGLRDQGDPRLRHGPRRGRRARDRSPVHVLLLRHHADLLPRRDLDRPRQLPEGPGRPRREEGLLGPGLPRRRRRDPPGRPDAARRRAARAPGNGRRAPAPQRRAGRDLHQRRAGLDRRPRALQPPAKGPDPRVHHRPGPRRPRRAGPRDRGRRDPGLAPDHRRHGPLAGGRGLPRAGPRGRGADRRHVVRGAAAAGPVGPRPGLQGHAHGRGGRRGPRRLPLVQEPAGGHPRRPHGPAGHVRDDLAVQADPLLGIDAGEARRPRPVCGPRRPQRADGPLGPAEPVALRRLQGDARRPPDDLQGRSNRHELLRRGPLSVPRRRRGGVRLGDRPRVQAPGADREVAPPPGGPADPAEADRRPAQDDVPHQHVGHVPGPPQAPLGRPASEPRVAGEDRLLRPRG